MEDEIRRVSLPRAPPDVYLTLAPNQPRVTDRSAPALSPTAVRSGPMLPPRPLTTWQARHPFSWTSFFAEVDLVHAGGLAVVAVAAVAIHFEEGALVGGERIGLAEIASKERLLPVRDLAVGRVGVDGPALAAVAGRAAEALHRVPAQRLLRVGAEGLLGLLEALPGGRLMGGYPEG
jgi:hypothetical protein